MIDRAERLKYAMDLCGISAADLSRKTGFSKSSISQYLGGLHAPTKGGTELLADALGVNPAWLFGFDVPMNMTYTEKQPDNIGIDSTGFIRIGDSAVSVNHIVMITYKDNKRVNVLLDTGQNLEGKMQRLESLMAEDVAKEC